jgi:hypothetical protein
MNNMHATLKIAPETASPELEQQAQAFFETSKSNCIENLLHRVRTTRQALLNESTYLAELELAIEAALDGGGDIPALLSAHQAELLAAGDAVRCDKAVWKPTYDLRRGEAESIVRSATEKPLALPKVISALTILRKYRASPVETLERDPAAGLADANI